MKTRARWLAVIALLASAAARSHPAPNSMLRLEFETTAVRAEYWLPVSELVHARASDPEGDVSAYLVRRVAAESSPGAAWDIRVKAIRKDRYQDHDYLVAELNMAPPAGIAPRPFVLIDDVITHEVRNHVVFVLQSRAGGDRLIGMLQYPSRRLVIPATD